MHSASWRHQGRISEAAACGLVVIVMMGPLMTMPLMVKAMPFLAHTQPGPGRESQQGPGRPRTLLKRQSGDQEQYGQLHEKG